MNATAAALAADLRAHGATDIRPALALGNIVAFSLAGDAVIDLLPVLAAGAEAGRYQAVFTQADVEAGRYAIDAG